MSPLQARPATAIAILYCVYWRLALNLDFYARYSHTSAADIPEFALRLFWRQ
jgi:hypothetical protein